MRAGAALESVCLETLNSGVMTKDLIGLEPGFKAQAVTSGAFINAIAARFAPELVG